MIQVEEESELRFQISEETLRELSDYQKSQYQNKESIRRTEEGVRVYLSNLLRASQTWERKHVNRAHRTFYLNVKRLLNDTL